MRIIIFLLLISFINKPAYPQIPSKKEMQTQMLEAMNELNNQIAELERQIVEAKKNKEDEETIKQLEDQLALLKKQVAMLGGVNKGIGNMSAKTFQQAADIEQAKGFIPKRDSVRINSLPKKIFNDAELFSFVKRAHADVEKLIPAAERKEALQIYNETRAKFKSDSMIKYAASGCWIYGHWQKTLWLAGKACLDDMTDFDNLNNYAAFLTMVGAEQAALPILEYLNKKYPENSTILNNIGQAWFGLGDMEKAKKNLESATTIYPYHSMANLTLSKIYISVNDSQKAITAIRNSIKIAYTPEKEAELESLGGELEEEDIDFEYPMDDDPFGFEPFFKVFPAVPGGIGESPRATAEWDAFYEAVDQLNEQLKTKEDEAEIRTTAFMNKMTNSNYNQPVLKMHNTNAKIKAGRKLLLARMNKTALSIDEIMNLMANAYHNVTTQRLNALELQRREDISRARDCEAQVAVNNNFMAAAKAIIDEGGDAMNQVYFQNKAKVHKYIQLTAYSLENDYTERMGKFHKEIWQKNQWMFTYQRSFVLIYRSMRDRPAMYFGCEEPAPVPRQTKQLPPLKKPECTHSATLNLPVGTIKEECNTISIDESKLKFRENNSQEGEIKIGDKVIECDASGHIKLNVRPVDRARGESTRGNCPVSSGRTNTSGSTSHMIGGMIAR